MSRVLKQHRTVLPPCVVVDVVVEAVVVFVSRVYAILYGHSGSASAVVHLSEVFGNFGFWREVQVTAKSGNCCDDETRSGHYDGQDPGQSFRIGRVGFTSTWNAIDG